MKNFDEIYNNLNEADFNFSKNLQTDELFENKVFVKIAKKKKIKRVSVVVSIVFAIFGAVFSYMMTTGINQYNNQNKNKANLISYNKDDIKKEEVWLTDDVYFSTYDENSNYGYQQVSLEEVEDEI